MSSLMISISGLRGVVGDSLTPEVIVKYVAAYAEYCSCGPVVLGRDGRVTGTMVANIASSTLRAMGSDVIDLGICPTPTVQLAVEKLKASGGIAVTASHNPMQWNGLKFLAQTGLFLNADENGAFWKLAASERTYASWDHIGNYSANEGFIDRHIHEVVSLPYIDLNVTARRKFRIVLDCVNAAGSRVMPKLLGLLGCEVIPLYCDGSGVFGHTPEPIPENLGDLARKVVEEHADFGIAVDPDVDRVVFIDENGTPIGEEYTVTSAVRFILSKEKKDGARVVVNLSTTRAVEDVARQYNAVTIRTPVGEINVAGKMRSVNALVGGEGSGGVILPRVHLGRDALVGAALMVQQLAEFGGTMSAFRSALPQYSITKDKIALGSVDPDTVIGTLRHRYAGEKMNTDDGLRIDFADTWVHLRKSNTEPIIRIIAEGRTPDAARSIADTFLNEIKSI